MRAGLAGCRIRSGDQLRRHRRGRAERRVVQRGKIFARGANRVSLTPQASSPCLATERCLLASAAMRLASTAKSSAPDEPFRHAAPNDALEHMTQQIALAKTAVAVLGKRRMIRDVAVEPQPTEME